MTAAMTTMAGVEPIKVLVDGWRKDATSTLAGVCEHISQQMFDELLTEMFLNEKFLDKVSCTSTRESLYGDVCVTTGDINETFRSFQDPQSVDLRAGNIRLRVELKQAIKLPQVPEGLELKKPNLVRLKEKFSFFYESGGHTSWRFDMIKWRLEEEGVTHYELSLEPLRVPQLLHCCRSNVAQSLLLQVGQLFFGIPAESNLQWSCA